MKPDIPGWILAEAVQSALDAMHPHLVTYGIDRRERIRAKYERIIGAALSAIYGEEPKRMRPRMAEAATNSATNRGAQGL